MRSTSSSTFACTIAGRCSSSQALSSGLSNSRTTSSSDRPSFGIEIALGGERWPKAAGRCYVGHRRGADQRRNSSSRPARPRRRPGLGARARARRFVDHRGRSSVSRSPTVRRAPASAPVRARGARSVSSRHLVDFRQVRRGREGRHGFRAPAQLRRQVPPRPPFCRALRTPPPRRPARLRR